MYPSKGSIGIWEGLFAACKGKLREDTHDSEIPSIPLGQQRIVPQDSMGNIDNNGSHNPGRLICPNAIVPFTARSGMTGSI